MRILVTGATGFLGRFAVRALASAGHDVRALVRDRDRAQAVFGADVELSVGSALDGRAVRTALSGCDGLVQAAGVYSYDRRNAARTLAETPALAATALSAAHDARLTRVVDIASTVVYTTATDRVTTATRLAAPGDPTWSDPYVRAKVAAEGIGAAHETRGLPRVTLHPSRVLGPEDSPPGTSGASVIQLLAGGLTTNARGGWVDVRDVADAVVCAFGAPVSTHAIISSSSMRYRQLAPVLESLTGRRHARLFLGPIIIRVGARLNDLVGGRVVDMPAARAIEYVLTAPPIDGSSGEALLGRPYRPFEDTVADTLAWWAANGVIDRKLAGTLAR